MYLSRSKIQVAVWMIAAIVVLAVAFLPSLIFQEERENAQSTSSQLLAKTVSAQPDHKLLQTVSLPAADQLQETTTFKRPLPEERSTQKNRLATSWASFRNGNAQQGVAGSSLPEKLSVLWKINDPDGFVCSAAIVGDDVIAGALSGTLYNINRTTGKIRWKYRTIDSTDPDEFAPGFKGAPRVTNDLIFIGDEEGIVHAIDRKTGKKKWRYKTEGEIAGCVAVVGKNILVGSYDSNLYCLNGGSGELVWKFQTGDRINGSPAVVGNYTFVAGCDEHLRVIDISKGKEQGNVPLESYLIASPAVMGDMLYVGTHNAEVVALNWKQQKIVWRYQRKEKDFPYHASAAVTDQYVVVGGHDKRMHCINRKTGKEVWTFLTRAQINSSAAIVKDRLFFGSNDRHLYELKLKDGKQLWKFNMGNKVTAGIAIGENCLIAGTEGPNGTLFCFGEKKK